MNDLRYEVRIWWSEKDRLFLAEAPELPGCLTHGPTYEKALKKIRELIPFWIETARQDGDPVPPPGKREPARVSTGGPSRSRSRSASARGRQPRT